MARKVDARAPMFQDEVRRVVNMALYGMDDDEIVAEMGSDIDGVIITERWVRFVAKQARRGAFENPRKTTMAKINKPKTLVKELLAEARAMVGTVDVNVSDEALSSAMRIDLNKAIRRADGTVVHLTPSAIDAVVKYALKVHHENQNAMGRIRNNPTGKRKRRSAASKNTPVKTSVVKELQDSARAIVGAIDVNASDEAISSMMRIDLNKAIRRADGTVVHLTPSAIDAVVKYALKVHHENQNAMGRIRNNPGRKVRVMTPCGIKMLARHDGRRIRRNPDDRKVVAVSEYRYRATAAQRRMSGGRTVTQFIVHYEGDDPSKWARVMGYGPTPGERKTNAIRWFKATR